ncbi:MAG: calcium-binding protein [Pseudomonadota bacterium]
MGGFRVAHRATVFGPDDGFLRGVSDIALANDAVDSKVYVLARGEMDGRLAAYNISHSGSLERIDEIYGDLSPRAGLEGTLGQMRLAGAEVVIASGVNQTSLWGAELDPSGGFNTEFGIASSEPLPSDLVQVTAVELFGSRFAYGTRFNSDTFEIWRVASDGSFQNRLSVSSGLGGGALGLSSFEFVEVSGVPLLLATSHGALSLASYALNGLGIPTMVANVAMAGGLGISGPSDLAVVQVNSQSFALVAAAGSSSLTVFAVSENGALTAIDHVLDDRATRFADVTELEVIELGPHAFVAVAGSDDGISLFQILPSGRLLHLQSIEDQTDTTLRNVSALALAADRDYLQIYVSGTEDGLTAFESEASLKGQLRVAPAGGGSLTGGAGYDVLQGGSGDDHIVAGSGGSVLIDGPGRDRLQGGAGADVFVLDFDGDYDIVVDFDLGNDRVDLSAWEFLRSAAQLDVQTVSTGANIRFNGERLDIRTSDARSLSVDDLQAAGVIAQARILPEWINYAPDSEVEGAVPRITGTAGADELHGSASNEELLGLGSDDLLRGNAGDDVLDGGAGADFMNGGPGSDIFYVDDLGDRISESRKWDGTDHVYADVDFITGRVHIEEITLTGSADIRAIGNGLPNTIRGNDGNNILDGKKQVDTMLGGKGNDLYVVTAPGEILIEEAGEGIDTVRAYRSWKLEDNMESLELRSEFDFNAVGNELDNLLVGNGGDNMLIGREGADTLRGKGGADTFVFDRSPGPDNVDTILDFTSAVDTIKIKGNLFGGLTNGALVANAFHLGTRATEAEHRFIYDRESGDLSVDVDGAGGQGAQLIMDLGAGTDLQGYDVFIF